MTAAENKFITFGCRLNSYESEAIKQAVADSKQNNLIVFNSCAVTSEAERQLRQSVRKARRENPHARIVVTGCAAQIDPERYAKMTEVDLVLGNQEKSRAQSYMVGDSALRPLPARGEGEFGARSRQEDLHLPLGQRTGASGGALKASNENSHQDKLFLDSKKSSRDFLNEHETSKILVNDIMSVRENAPQLVSYFENRTRAFLEIQNGCNHRCTFCVIPFGRGNSRSVAFGEIAAQTRKMVELGHQEIVLTGVDISDYGKDLAVPISLAQMIKRLLNLVPELPRLRLSSIDVAEIDNEMLDLIAHEKRFMPYLHLSVQSGDNMILKRMKRRHNREQILEFCAKVRKLRPEITFGADIIAGFPTEDDEMFENSLRLISEADIIFPHIFPYSKREGTPAAKMPQLKSDIIKNRAKALREAGEEQLKKYLLRMIGKKIKVIIEKNGLGKSENFLDVYVDGINSSRIGEILEVDIIDIRDKYLTGSLDTVS